MVKLEGAGPQLDAIRFLVRARHPGLRAPGPDAAIGAAPRRLQGAGPRGAAAAQKLLDDALAVAEAGADLLVLECVPSALAARDHRATRDPDHRHRRRARTATARSWCCTTCSASTPAIAGRASSRISWPRAARSPARSRAYADAVRDGSFPARRTRLRSMMRIDRDASPTCARSVGRLAARRPARRLRADHGQPARRPLLAGRAGARSTPTAWSPASSSTRPSSARTRTSRAIRARPTRTPRACDAPAATCCCCPTVEEMYPFGTDRLRADARAGHHRHPRRRAPPRPFRRRGARWSRACSTWCSRTSRCSAARITSSCR